VGDEDLVRAKVPEADQIVVPYGLAHLLVVGDREDLPVVVGIVVGVSGNLLALAGDTTIIVAERVVGVVAVEVGLGLLVPDGKGVVVLNVDRVGQHDVVTQRLLELGRHEIVTGTRSGQDGEVNLEPEQVEDEGHDDESESTGGKVLSELGQTQRAAGPLNVEEIPEINDDGRANGDEGEEADVLGRDVAGEGKAGEDQPLPPLAAKGLVAQLVELDVAQEAASHGENKRGIQQDQASLANVRIVQENQSSGDDAGGQAVARLPHDEVGDGHGAGTKDRRKGSVRDVGNLVRNVGIANVLEVEVAIVSNKPSHEGEEQLSEGRVDIEEVGSLQVVRGKLAKVHLVENDLVGVADAPESSDKGQQSYDAEADLVIKLARRGLLLSSSLGELVQLGLRIKGGRIGGLFARDVSLPQAALGRLRSSHGSRGLGSEKAQGQRRKVTKENEVKRQMNK
jgi:hypothetical protein